MSFLIPFVSIVLSFCMTVSCADIQPVKTLKKIDVSDRGVVLDWRHPATAREFEEEYEDEIKIFIIKDFQTQQNKSIEHIFKPHYDKTSWLYFIKKNKDDHHPLEDNQQKSKVWGKSLYEMAKIFESDRSNLLYGAMHGVICADNANLLDRLYKPFYSDKVWRAFFGTASNEKFKDLDSFADDLFKKLEIEKPNQQTFAQFKADAMAAMAYNYKIHLQVKPEYILSFVRDLLSLIADNEQLSKYIRLFKITRFFQLGYQLPPEESKGTFLRIPTIVLYLCLIPGDKKEKQTILDSIIDPIVKRYEQVAEEIALRDENGNAIQPRDNAKINDLIWIAGGNGDDKVLYKKYIKDEKLENSVYTQDYAFIKGYEYTYSPKKATQKQDFLIRLRNFLKSIVRKKK